MNLFRALALFFTTATLLVLFQNCDVVKQPKVDYDSMSIVAYPHSGNETTCAECHEQSRPTSLQSALGYNSAAPFIQTPHGNGMDCAVCHSNISRLNRLKADWAYGFFVHKLTLTSCQECHAGQRPATTSGGAPHPAIGDCLSCHQSTLTSIQGQDRSSYAAYNLNFWRNATGLPTSSVFDIVKNTSVVVQTPTYTGADLLSSWSSANQTLHMPMNHSEPVPGVGMSNCTLCHSNTTNYSGGRFHNSLTVNSIAQPSSCTGCHSPSQPDTVPSPTVAGGTVAFVGIANGLSATTNPSLFNHQSSQAQADCSSCHTQSSWNTPTWRAGQFHRTTKVSTTCQDCHRPTRPTTNVAFGSGTFSHATSGTGECAGCHASTITALGAKTVFLTAPNKLQKSDWAGGISTPTGLVGSTSISITALKLTTSNNAVTGKVSSTNNLVLQMNHGAYNTANCTTCHVASTFTGGKFHKSQATQPTSCKTCHNSALEGFVLGSSLAKPLDHNHASVKSVDCTTCHTAPTATNSALNFKDGLFHTKVSPQPTTCKECHSPKVLDQPVWGSMNHATIGAADCASCHQFPGTGTTAAPNWKGSSSSMPATVSMNPPSGTSWGNLNIAHPIMASSNTGISCASCHGTNTAAKIIGYDHSNPPTGAKCVYCHYSGQQVTSVQVSTASHRSASPTKDCSSSGCHSPTYPKWNTTSKSWTGGGGW